MTLFLLPSACLFGLYFEIACQENFWSSHFCGDDLYEAAVLFFETLKSAGDISNCVSPNANLHERNRYPPS